MAGQILPTLFIVALGVGTFLRLVAKEKHRREKHLQFRLDEQMRTEEERELAEQKTEQARIEAGPEPAPFAQEYRPEHLTPC